MARGHAILDRVTLLATGFVVEAALSVCYKGSRVMEEAVIPALK